MRFVRSIFYHGTGPEAIPKGIISVDLLDTADLLTDVKDTARWLTNHAFFDNSVWQVGCTMDDKDLVVKLIPHKKFGEVGNYLLSDQIITEWQYQQIKKQSGVVFSEHTLNEQEAVEYCEN